MNRLLPALLLLFCAPLSATPISSETMAAVLVIGDAAGVPRSVTRALVHEESRGDATARSQVTAEGFCSRGLVQLYTRPDNLAYLLAHYWPGDLAEFDIDNPLHNATVGLGYLAALHRRFGNWYEACIFYNAGRIAGAPTHSKQYARRIINAR
jgi:soluble lytic murein transglycosylase-like protein